MLLHLDSGAHLGDGSVSRRLTRAFADAWRSDRPEAGYVHRDLLTDPAPPLDSAFCELGRAVEHAGSTSLDRVPGLARTPAQRRAWELTAPLVAELRAAGTVLIGAPMYNLSVPAALKAWIDRVSFPGAVADPATGAGLLGGTRVVVVSPRGGAYGAGTGRERFEHCGRYLRAYFERHGVAPTDVHLVTPELTTAGLGARSEHLRPAAESSLAAATAALSLLARRRAVSAR